MFDDGDHSHPGPSFEVKFCRLRTETRAEPEAGVQYLLHFSRVQIITSQHPTHVVGSSPDSTPSSENTIKAKEGRNFTRTVGATLGKIPNVIFGVSATRQFETEEVQNKSKVAVFLNAEGAPGERVIQWDYTIEDKKLQQVGCTFDNPPAPWVKLAFNLPNKPHLEIDLLMYWSIPHDTTTQLLNFSRLLSFGKKKRVCAPVFTNLLQQVSISVPLDNLEGISWLSHTVETKTPQQPLKDDGLQCKATDERQVSSKSSPIDLKVAFGCALHGLVKSRKEMIGMPNTYENRSYIKQFCRRNPTTFTTTNVEQSHS